MGGCLSKKAKKDPNTSSLLGSKKEAEGSRDPPPTESPPQIEEEKVKEVLSETPTRFVRANSNRREPAKVANGLKMEELDLGSYINAADLLCSSRSVGVLANPPSESISAASTSLISDNTGAAAPHDDDDDDDDDDEEGETAEMKLKMMLMKKKKKRSLSSSSVGMPRSRSPAAKTRGPAPAAAAAGKREFRAVDVGCRSGRPSPSPMRSREMGNYARNHTNSSSSYNGNIYNNTKTGDTVLIGERDGRRMRSMSPAASSLKSRSSELEEAAAAAATKISLDHQHQQRGRHCRSLSSSTATNGRFSPQRIPARALDLGARRRGNPNAGGGSAGDGDGMTLLMEEGKEESLENPLVSLECFIFL